MLMQMPICSKYAQEVSQNVILLCAHEKPNTVSNWDWYRSKCKMEKKTEYLSKCRFYADQWGYIWCIDQYIPTEVAEKLSKTLLGRSFSFLTPWNQNHIIIIMITLRKKKANTWIWWINIGTYIEISWNWQKRTVPTRNTRT